MSSVDIFKISKNILLEKIEKQKKNINLNFDLDVLNKNTDINLKDFDLEIFKKITMDRIFIKRVLIKYYLFFEQIVNFYFKIGAKEIIEEADLKRRVDSFLDNRSIFFIEYFSYNNIDFFYFMDNFFIFLKEAGIIHTDLKNLIGKIKQVERDLKKIINKGQVKTVKKEKELLNKYKFLNLIFIFFTDFFIPEILLSFYYFIRFSNIEKGQRKILNITDIKRVLLQKFLVNNFEIFFEKFLIFLDKDYFLFLLKVKEDLILIRPGKKILNKFKILFKAKYDEEVIKNIDYTEITKEMIEIIEEEFLNKTNFIEEREKIKRWEKYLLNFDWKDVLIGILNYLVFYNFQENVFNRYSDLFLYHLLLNFFELDFFYYNK